MWLTTGTTQYNSSVSVQAQVKFFHDWQH